MSEEMESVMRTHLRIEKITSDLDVERVNARKQAERLAEAFEFKSERIAELEASNARLKELSVYIYNRGYESGHHHTVEGGFTPVHYSEMATYHSEEVAELIEDLGETPAKSLRVIKADAIEEALQSFWEAEQDAVCNRSAPPTLSLFLSCRAKQLRKGGE